MEIEEVILIMDFRVEVTEEIMVVNLELVS
jgi:hypothetical protein